MNRTEGRELAKSTLEDLQIFDQVESHEPELYTGARIAVIHSKGLGLTEETRDGTYSLPAEIWVTVFVRRQAGAGATVEDLLDDLVHRSVVALAVAFRLQTAKVEIVSVAGVPTGDIKGKDYRMERFAVRFNEE